MTLRTGKAESGCNLYASCLRCPLPRCQFDEPIRLTSTSQRRTQQAELRASIRSDLAANMTWDAIQAKYGCSRGLISNAKAEGERGSSTPIQS